MLHLIKALITVLKFKRACPKCGRNQIIKPSQKDETVPCKFCKEDIPPQKKRALKI